jgi:hypothetical protein
MLKKRESKLVIAALPSRPSSIETILDELLRALGSLEDTPSRGRASAITTGEPWQDDEYVYLETHVRNEDVPFCDISIMDGRVFVRMSRNLEDLTPPTHQTNGSLVACEPLDDEVEPQPIVASA